MRILLNIRIAPEYRIKAQFKHPVLYFGFISSGRLFRLFRPGKQVQLLLR